MAVTRRSERSGPEEDDGLDLRPLTARSVVLSLLLGSHPPRLPVRTLVACGSLFHIGEGALRVALSRLATAGDVLAEGGIYTLSDRLLRRQHRQDLDRRPPTDAWDGTWVVLLTPVGNTDPASARLAPVAPGVWMRPDNLDRPAPVRARFGDDSQFLLVARPEGDSALLIERLWDLSTWAGKAGRLMAAFDEADRPAGRFVVAAAILRHLRTDPLLPPELLPPSWPGGALRATYDRFEQELAGLLAHPFAPQPGGNS